MKQKNYPSSSTTLYKRWQGMKTRCNNPKAENYSRYGAKGVKYCEGFSVFSNFYKILGDPPSNNHSLDRIKSDLNYTCGKCNECKINGFKLNVKWSTLKEQSCNRGDFINKITFNGITLNLQQWCDKLGIKRPTLNNRINTYGWSIDRALSEPVFKRKK